MVSYTYLYVYGWFTLYFKVIIMSFKIVQTEEPGRDAPSLTIVPCGWENNNILFWPKNKKNVLKLIKDLESKPEKDWTKYPCYKKRESFLLYKSAESELEAMLQNYDSESDYNNSASKAIINKNKQSSTSDEAYQKFNYLAAKSCQVCKNKQINKSKQN